MNNLSLQKLLYNVEKKWLHELFRFCSIQFQQTHLPSHDQYHHFRVWHFARELMHELAALKYIITPELAESVILSVFLHDTGMSRSLGESHGKESVKLFKEFLSSITKEPTINLDRIFNAIENHDNKNYILESFHQAFSEEHELLSILNISDDLDAFGYIGIYRYAEIYLLRGIPLDSLADEVIRNVDKRFLNIETTLHKMVSFTESHRKRFETTRRFYSDMSEGYYKFTGKTRSGPSGVIDLISKEIISNKKGIDYTIQLVEQNIDDEYIKNYFSKFKEENTSFQYPQVNL